MIDARRISRQRTTMTTANADVVEPKVSPRQNNEREAIDTAAASGSKSAPRGKSGRGGSRQDASPTIQLSKALSYILRHGAAKEHLKISADGYISLECVLARPKLSKIKMEHGSSPTQEDVMQVVESNDKKRFEISKRESDQLFIRAVQGHSISEVDEEVRLPEGVEILHGTTKEAWEKIRETGGLSRMKRNHIHLAKGRPGSDSVISGMRSSSAMIISIDLIAALRDGVSFFVASNGAVLTSGKGDSGILSLDYISKVEESKTGIILWQPTPASKETL